jgi:hypothetical protein
MYFKKNYFNKELIKEFEMDFGFEFALALYDFNSNIGLKKDIADIIFVDEQNKEKKHRTVFIDYSQIESGDLVSLGKYDYNDEYTFEKYVKETKYKKSYLKKLTNLEIEERRKDINEKKYNQAKELMDNYKNKVFEKTIFDKEGKEFKIEIIENTSSRYNEEQSHNLLNLYDGKKIVGYLKMIYTNEKLFKHYNPTSFHIHDSMIHINKDYKLPLIYTEKELLLSLEKRHIIKNVNYEDPKKELKKQENKFKRKHKKVLDAYIKETMNIAIPQYSRVGSRDDKNKYKNSGLGTLMYFYMSRYFNEKNIVFSASRNQTEEARNLWKSLKSNFPDFVSFEKEIYYDKPVNVGKISVPKNEEISYVDGKIERVSSVEDYLKNKTKKTNTSKLNNKGKL